MIHYVPIEPYESRYTKDWYTLFPSEFDRMGIPYDICSGDSVTNHVGASSVFSPTGTNIYKMSQLQKLCEWLHRGEIKDGDIIFFADLWFPGIECLFYIRDMLKINFKITGILHAGTWDIHDFTSRNGMIKWGRHFEQALLQGADEVYVATNFHKELIELCGLRGCEKIKVTGIPFYAERLRKQYLSDDVVKENIIVFPHRIEVEKHPEIFDEVAKRYPDWRFIKTLEVTKTRDEYFRLLAKSKIMLSFADQETFGFSTVEAMALDNIVLVPNKLSYVETVPEALRYDTMTDFYNKLDDIMSTLDIERPQMDYDLDKWADSVERMLNHMLNL